MRILPIILIVCFCLVYTQADALDVFETKRVFSEVFDNASMPADAAFTSAGGSFVVYDAMRSSFTHYKNYKKGQSKSSKEFLGGTCLKLIDGSYYFCKPSGGLAVLDKNFKNIGNIGSEKSVITDVVKFGNKLFMVDKGSHNLSVADFKNGNITETVGERGSGQGYFNFPFSIISDKDGFLFVTDVLNARVQMISDAMKSVLTIAPWGLSPGESYRPKGIALYLDKYILVSDGYLGVIQIFDMDGKFIGVIGDEKGKIKRYFSPTRIRTSGNMLAVIDPYARLVEILDIGGLK